MFCFFCSFKQITWVDRVNEWINNRLEAGQCERKPVKEIEIYIIILEVSKQGENKVSRKLNERKLLLITNQHIIRLGCTHGDEMPAEIKGQLFPILNAVGPKFKENRPTQ